MFNEDMLNRLYRFGYSLAADTDLQAGGGHGS